jgi:hypothetical protein
MTDDIQKILDSISLVQDVALAGIGDKASIERLSKRADLPDSVKKYVAGFGKPVEESGKPKPEDFKSDIEFAKALIAWDAEKTAKASPSFSYKKPVRADFVKEDDFKTAEAAYAEFISNIKKELTPEIGDAVKKSFMPQPRFDPNEKADLAKLFKDAGEADRMDDFLYKEGVLK